MERKTIPEAENRLLILYALDRLGPVTGTQLLRFLMEYDLMNYITMQLGLCEMEEQGQLKQHPHPLGGLMELTEAGQYALNAFAHRIPQSRRTLVDREAQVWHERFRLEQQTPADSYSLPGGEQCLRLRLMEGDAALMDLLLTLPRDAALSGVQERWRAAAHRVYGGITERLTAAYAADAPLTDPLPPSATLQRAGKEWYLFLEREGFTVMLSLPDEGLARCCAQAWPGASESLGAMVREALTHP